MTAEVARTCKVCGLEWPIENFEWTGKKGAQWRSRRCDECRRADMRRRSRERKALVREARDLALESKRLIELPPMLPIERVIAERAACKGAGPLFINAGMHSTPAEQARIRATCASCPVIEECRELGDHIESNPFLGSLVGVWGGEFPIERANRRRSRAAA